MARTERVKRTKINGPRNILTIKGQEPGFNYRFVNDTGDRIKEMEELGYELVRDQSVKVGDKRVAIPTSDGSAIRSAVGTNPDGSPLYAYVMRQRDEFYKEDQATKAAHVDETEADIKRTARKNSDYGDLQITRG
jgi:hypothetical protein